MSSSSSYFFDDILFVEDSPAAPPVLGGAVQPVEVRSDVEASATNETSTDEDVLLDSKYARGLQSIYTASDEIFFRHNLDIR